ncbi:MAG: hypothetical protein VYC80_02745 [Planctomycetota bacterium]|jgi:hypothetical protein|nr:hypothetical protein [Planctomycetota bacterium]MEC7447777.1 hypothetical protein [Planctomycetota bacterium]MEC7497836.1 hypothetical protein [Planctomycetota bacterium]MEC7718364.1 hypothetical protein [Planctomycetota bacterium]MEC8301246.1 hypothetical protein [Planctomycetota bacterium]
MPAIYENHGLHFAYPENWQLMEPEQDPGLVDVTLQTPNGGFWSVQLMPSEVLPEECIEQIFEGLEAEYEDLERESASCEFAGVACSGDEVRFFCLDMLVEVRVWACQHAGRTFVCHYQAEQSEFLEIEPVFRAIATSLFQGQIEV